MDFRVLLYLARQELLRILSEINDSNFLFIDESLMKRIDILVSASSLKECRVVKICKLGSPVQNSCGRFVYITNGETKTLKKVIDQILSDKKVEIDRKYNIIFVPQINFECEELLARNGLIEDVELVSAFIGLIPLGKDILSLGITDFFHSTFLDNVWTWVHTVVRSLDVLQSCFGPFSQIHAFGEISGIVENSLQHLASESPGLISHLMLIDRKLDLVTPFTTNITYGGILCEVFGLREDIITLPADQPALVAGNLSLSNPDKILEEFCDLHFSNVTLELSRKVKILSSSMEKNLSATTLNELRKFVASDLGAFREDQRQLVQHMSVCEYIQQIISEPDVLFSIEHTTIQDADRTVIVDYVLDLVYRNMDEYLALSLVVLLSQTTGVVWKAEIEPIVRAFCHTYGFKYLSIFEELTRTGLITVNMSGKASISRLVSNLVKPSCPFRNIAKKLNSLPSQKMIESELWKDMSDVSYLFNGCYIPIIYRIVEEFLNSLGDEQSSLSSFGRECNVEYNAYVGDGGNSMSSVMVYVLGGCTMQEIAALRFLSRKKGINIIIGCTSIVNKFDMLRNFVEID